jgi:hypothetical protein
MFDKLIEQEWPAMKQAPSLCLLLVCVGFLSGIGLGLWYFKDRMDDQNQKIDRYRIAAGLAQPTPKTSLMDLNNVELKGKANRLAARIREIISIHHGHWDDIRKRNDSEKWTDERYKLSLDQEMRRAWLQFETIRVDALMVSDELRARTSPQVHEKIVTATPHFRSADEPKAELSISRLATGPFLVSAAVFLAGELEELSKLQLVTLETCRC